MTGEGRSKVKGAVLTSLLSVTAPGAVLYLTIGEHGSLFWSSFSPFNWVAFLVSLHAYSLVNSWAWNGLARKSKDSVLNKTIQQFIAIQRLWKHLHFLYHLLCVPKIAVGTKNLKGSGMRGSFFVEKKNKIKRRVKAVVLGCEWSRNIFHELSEWGGSNCRVTKQRKTV